MLESKRNHSLIQQYCSLIINDVIATLRTKRSMLQAARLKA